MIKHSNDGVVIFKEADHTYTNTKTNKRLTSVTTFIGSCINPFDEDYHSKKKADQLGLSQEEVLLMWKLKADNSQLMGTFIHLMFENHYNKIPYEVNHRWGKTFIALGVIRKYYETNIIRVIHSELIVYNNHLSGQIDCVAETDKGIYIIDYKTNDAIKRENYRKFMLNDLAQFNIPDANFYEYSVQLSAYKVMFEKTYNKEIKGLFVIHIGEKGYEWYKMNDYSRELKTLEQFAD